MSSIILVCFFRDISRCYLYLVSYSRDAHEVNAGLHIPYRCLILTEIVIYRQILVTFSTTIYYENTFCGFCILTDI
jgi:hypothetical protein